MEFNAARRELQELSLFVWLVMTCSARVGLSRSTIVDGPEVYEDRDSAQREAEGPRAFMDYSAKLLDTKKTQIERGRIRAIRESNCTSVTRTGQRTPYSLLLE